MFQSLDFEKNNKTSRDHLLIQDLSRLSVDTFGTLKWKTAVGVIPVSAKDTPLFRRRRPLGKTAWEAPDQGLERSFCCCFTGQRPVSKENPQSTRIRPISVLRFWISEDLTQAESQFQGVEFSCPWGIPRKFWVNECLSRDDLSRETGRNAGVCEKKTLLLHEPLPYTTAAKTPLQPLVWCFNNDNKKKKKKNIYIYIYGLMFFKLSCLGVFFSGGVFFSQTPVYIYIYIYIYIYLRRRSAC